jgi:hypothetical protein
MGNLYVADGASNRNQIQRIAPDGTVTTIVSENDHTITDLTVTPGGDIFYSSAGDPTSGRGFIWRIVNGTPVRVTSEEMAISEFVIDPASGNLYVGIWTPNGPEVKLVGPDGSVTTLFSINEAHGAPASMTMHNGVLWLGWRDGPYTGKCFRWSSERGLHEILLSSVVDYSSEMVATSAGIYITGYRLPRLAGEHSCMVYLLNPNTLEMTHVAGQEGASCSGPGQDGTGQAARLDVRFSKIAQGSDGNLYLTEYFSHTIRRITPAGEVTTYAGVPDRAGS